MNVLIYEHLMACGAAQASESMVDEGCAMLRSAMRDFGEIAEPFCIAQEGLLERLGGVGHVRPVVDDPVKAYATALEECDAVLIIAPETGGTLYKMTAMAEFRKVLNLGCQPEAIEATGNKLVFDEAMRKLGIPTPKTLQAACYFDSTSASMGRWISKPVDGAGCENVFTHERGTRVSMPQDGSLIAQEYVEGEPMSASVVAGESGQVVVSVNRQTIRGVESMEYLGGEVTDMDPGREIMEMANRIWEGIPGLMGYWGIDYIQTPSGPVVIEVNPRLTTSYCALARAIGVNPATIILAAAKAEKVNMDYQRRSTRFSKTGEIIA